MLAEDITITKTMEMHNTSLLSSTTGKVLGHLVSFWDELELFHTEQRFLLGKFLEEKQTQSLALV